MAPSSPASGPRLPTADGEVAPASPSGVSPATSAGKERSRRRKLLVVGLHLLSYATIIAVWQYFAATSDRNILPTPRAVLDRMIAIADSGELWFHFSSTVERALISLAILYVLGTVIGIAMGLSDWWEAFFRSWVTLILSLPGIVVVLSILLVMGLHPLGPILAIVTVNFPFVTVQVWEGVRSLPRDLVDMATAFGVSRTAVLRHVVIPALAPFLFTALSYGFALTWKITMLTELFGSSSGVGYMFRLNFGLFSVEGLLAWAIWSFALFLFLEWLLRVQAKRFFRWRQESFR
jgi:NitT/TauT family transport system permease protein